MLTYTLAPRNRTHLGSGSQAPAVRSRTRLRYYLFSSLPDAGAGARSGSRSLLYSVNAMFVTVGPVTPTAWQAVWFPAIVESPVKVIVNAMTMKQVEPAFPVNVTLVLGVYIAPVRAVPAFAVMVLSPVSPPPLLLVSA